MSHCKRPCRICRRWFLPHPRAGDRQRVCSEPDCQWERHRRADRAWHARNPHYDGKRRLREAAGLPDPGSLVKPADDPLDQPQWEVIERAIGSMHRTALEGVGRLLTRHTQDAVSSIMASVTLLSAQQLNICSQDVVAPMIPLPSVSSTKVPPPQCKTQSDVRARDP